MKSISIFRLCHRFAIILPYFFFFFFFSEVVPKCTQWRKREASERMDKIRPNIWLYCKLSTWVPYHNRARAHRCCRLVFGANGRLHVNSNYYVLVLCCCRPFKMRNEWDQPKMLRNLNSWQYEWLAPVPAPKKIASKYPKSETKENIFYFCAIFDVSFVIRRCFFHYVIYPFRLSFLSFPSRSRGFKWTQ